MSLIPWYVRYAPHIGLVVIVGLAFTAAAYGIKRIEDAGREAAKHKARVAELETLVGQRDMALDAWAARAEFWEAEKEAHAKLLSQTEAERNAALRAANENRRKYRDALEQLSEVERACAVRPVPDAVDRLLGKERQAAPAR